MTISFPDLSNHNGALAIEPGTVAVSAKASESTTFTDGQYPHYKSAAAKVGALFYAYHFLHAGNAAAQAKYCYSIVGPGVAVMIDCEPVGTSKPTVADCVAFATEFRALGGKCVLVYLPHWYWMQLGSPSLLPLKAAGLALISSAYTAYSDAGEGWAAYGGVTPAIWQWTDKQSYSGASVDFNAYKGTPAQLASLLGYSTAAPAAVTTEGEDEMSFLISVSPDPTIPAENTPTNPAPATAGIFAVTPLGVVHVDAASLAGLTGRLGSPAVVDVAFYDALLGLTPPYGGSGTAVSAADIASAVADHITVTVASK